MAQLAQPSTLADVLLVGVALLFAELRLREFRRPDTWSPAWYVADVVLGLALPLCSGLLGAVPVAVVAPVGLVLGLAGMATTGFVGAVLFAFGGNPLATWFVTPLLVGVALRALRLPPDLPRYERLEGPVFPGTADILWGLAGRAVCVLPLVGVLLIPGPDPWLRLLGAAVVGAVLLAADRGRRPLLMAHRKASRMSGVGLVLALAVVAAGPFGEWVARWWAETPSFDAWEVSRYIFYAAGVELLIGPAFHGTRLLRAQTRFLQATFGVLPLVSITSVTPFLVVGVFHPTHAPLVAATAGLGIGLLWLFTAHFRMVRTRQAADVLTLLQSPAAVRENLLHIWTTDTFQRRRWLRPRPWDYSLVRATTTLALRCSRAARLTTGVDVQPPWPPHVRLSHEDAPRLLALAEEILDLIDTRFPPIDPATSHLHQRQRVARAELAARAAEVSRNLADHQAAYTANRQSVDLLLESGAPTHAVLGLVEGAEYAMDLDDHDTALELLTTAKEIETAPAIRRYLLVNWAYFAHQAGQPEAQELWQEALAIPDRATAALRTALESDPVPYFEQEHPSILHRRTTQRELFLERTFTSH